MARRHQTPPADPGPRSMHPWRHRAALTAVAALAFIAVTAACGTTSDNTATTSTGPGGSTASTVATGTSSTSSTSSSTRTTTVSTSTSPSTAPSDDDGGIDPMTGADTSDKSGPAAGTGIALLSAVRAARHEGYDRVVFEFSNRTSARPGYTVRYVPKPIKADASGEEVPVGGSYVLQVRMEPASGVDLSNTDASDQPLVTYTGPKRFTPGTPEVAELVQSGDFEAVLNWSIGVRDKVDFRVATLMNPARLVIDIRNH